ncbi:MAG: glycosyltransferase family 2 protein [Planctomycetes bacterium]|nr:glycosyltransferase family 2 protein [Planctomycetota bacterium]
MGPRVSIGMPVYNGEAYVAEAIESILAQTYRDFELIISDNGSTDNTAAICRRYAEADERIRFHRIETNQGAAWNFNHLPAMAAGEYFKWAAHDDTLAPTYLQRCVDVLDGRSDVVLCYSRVRMIDGGGNVIGDYDVRVNTDGAQPAGRFYAAMEDVMCYAIFGLIRLPLLLTTPLLGAYAHADGVLLARLVLWGRFFEIPEYLFHSRRHPAQSAGRMHNKYMYAEWFDPSKAGRILLPNWRIDLEYARSVHRAPLSVFQRLRCYGAVGRELISDRRRLARDVVMAARLMWRRLRERRQPGPCRSGRTETQGGYDESRDTRRRGRNAARRRDLGKAQAHG